MKAKYPPEQATVRGILRTEFRYGPPSYGMSPWADWVETPTILTLTEPLDVAANPPTGEEGDYYAHAFEGVTELHVAPMAKPGREGNRNADWEELIGCVVEITGELCPAHTGHHHRPLLLFFDPADIRPVEVFGPAAPANARVFVRGSGIVINAAGYILTAQHVVQGTAYSVRRRLDRVEARLVGVHEELDVALLQADIRCEHQLPLRLQTPPALGERIYVCGFPLRPYLGHGLWITDGLVSGYGLPDANYFNISAPVQRGNSGGPVFDAFGNVLGLVSGRAAADRLLKMMGGQVADQNKVELLNAAVPIYSLWQFLKDRNVEIDNGPFWHAIPEDEPSLSGTRMARLAEQVCVEVEGWHVPDCAE